MNARQRVLGWLVAALALLCCAGLLGLPHAYTQRASKQLLQGFYPRPAIEEMLAEEAQEIPIVYALYQKRYLGADYRYSNADGGMISQQSQNSEEDLMAFSNLLTGLVESNVICAENADKMIKILGNGMLNTGSNPESAGFYRLILSAFDESDGTNNYKQATALLHDHTGKIVELNLNGFSVGENAEQLLKAYIHYLEVEPLNDFKASSSNTANKALFWSPTGQLYLYCAVKEDVFSFGVLSLPDEEVEKFFQD